MFRTLPKWTNKKLRLWHIASEACVCLLDYVAPMGTIIALCAQDEGERQGWKMPFLAIAMLAFLLFGLTRFLGKSIAKMPITDAKSQTLKHSLEAFSSIIVPACLMLACGSFATFLKDRIELYNLVVLACLGFTIAGRLIDKLVVSFLDDERSLREKAREMNAIERRRHIANGE